MTDEANRDEMTEAAPDPGIAPRSYTDLPLEEQVAALLGDLEQARIEAGQNLDQAQRAQAELVNQRRRADDERVAQVKYLNSRLITKLLPVLGELDLAVTHAGGQGADNAWLEGVKLIQRKLVNLLESEGVSAVEALQAMFNPLEHESILYETTELFEKDSVISIVREGYKLNDKVIRPTQVVVSKNSEHIMESIDKPKYGSEDKEN